MAILMLMAAALAVKAAKLPMTGSGRRYFASRQP
jgi:hypothetical protein